MNTAAHRPAPLRKIFGYALGEGATSITMNGISNFAMLFYTQVLGLNAAYAGIALSITMLWDAVTDPVMGHITDNTRSRFGRRHPYLLWGGLALAGCFLLLWILPGKFSSPVSIFWCVLLVNLAVRTAVTVFVVPYTALGFQICPEYTDRSRLQGIRFFFNMVVNLVFGACAWPLFFRDQVSDSGVRVDGALILENYRTMAVVLSSATVVLILLCIFFTRSYAVNNRDAVLQGNSIRSFWKDIAAIFKDRLAWFVFGFFLFAQMGMLLTSQVQMFSYVHYMKFSDVEKGFVHGAGMVAFALCSLNLSRVVRRYDKKQAGYIGIGLSMFGGLSLFTLFSGGVVVPQQTLTVGGLTVPLATILFGLFQSCWWGGCGMLVPLATSMIADISELNYKRTGILKDGGYAAAFSFFTKASASAGLLITGILLETAGVVSGAEQQTPEAIRNISIMTFLSGPAVILISIFILRKYPITREVMENLKNDSGPCI
jgi:GPH family glycoside/pentoside/hexuronide:cation symporter